MCVALFFVCLAVYGANGESLASWDSAPNSLLVFNAIENHRLDFDTFRGSYLETGPSHYVFSDGHGHLQSIFPVGSAILSAPLYFGFYLNELMFDGGPPPLTSQGFEPKRQHYEKFAASVITALAVVMFFLCALLLTDVWLALVLALLYAFGTSMWTISSQGLWQHGPLNLMLLVAAYALLRMLDEGDVPKLRWLIIAGLGLGFLPVIRPPALVFSVFLGLYVVRTQGRRQWLPFMYAAVLALLPGLLWNLFWFGTPLGGYSGDANRLGWHDIHEHLFGLFVSPSRGLLVFTPVLILATLGIRKARSEEFLRAYFIDSLYICCSIIVFVYALYQDWIGGDVYGPRFLTDILGASFLLLAFGLKEWLRRPVIPVLFWVFACWGVAVQFIGATSGAAGNDWNLVPVRVELQPERVWNLQDTQIERNLRALYYKDVAWNLTTSPQYRQGMAASIDAVRLDGSVGTFRIVHALIRNTGTSILYGYDTGVFVGQPRIDVSAFGSRQVVANGQLYLQGEIWPGQSGDAIGAVLLQNGIDHIECHLNAVGMPAAFSSARAWRGSVEVKASEGS